MPRLRIGPAVICVVVIVLAAARATPVLAFGPEDDTPGAVPADVEIIQCGDDPSCLENPCLDPGVILGPQPNTCVPCLEHSSAHVFNKVCVCDAGFREVRSDDWGRVTCVTDTDAGDGPSGAMQTVQVPAWEFHNAVLSLGISPLVTLLPHQTCQVGNGGNNRVAISIEPSAINISRVFLPAPEDPSDFTCRGELFQVTLQNGWQFSSLGPIEFSGCSFRPTPETKSITKENADPTDMTHDFVLRDWSDRICSMMFGPITLTGPAGLHWKTALGH